MRKVLTFNPNGRAFLREENLVVVLRGEPEKRISYDALVLTPLGQEVLCLVGSRSARKAAKTVAYAIRTPEIHEAYLGVIPDSSSDEQVQTLEVLWLKEAKTSETLDGSNS